MGKVFSTILTGIVGGFSALVAVVFWFGWGVAGRTQSAYLDPTRADYVDLMLVLTTVLLAAIGIGITVGALVIGLVAFKTLREIKDEAAKGAKDAVALEITNALPSALETALLDPDIGPKLLVDLAKEGVFDAAMNKALDQLNYGGPQ